MRLKEVDDRGSVLFFVKYRINVVLKNDWLLGDLGKGFCVGVGIDS